MLNKKIKLICRLLLFIFIFGTLDLQAFAIDKNQDKLSLSYAQLEDNNVIMQDDWFEEEKFTSQSIDEQGNTIETAYIIKNNEYYINSAIDYPGDEDYYMFTAPEQATYFFMGLEKVDVEITLYKNNQQLINNHNAAYGSNFELKYDLQEGETIYIKINSYNQSDIGLYSLLISKAVIISGTIKLPQGILASSGCLHVLVYA